MCAECHSTGVRKNYDAANDRRARVGVKRIGNAPSSLSAIHFGDYDISAF